MNTPTETLTSSNSPETGLDSISAHQPPTSAKASTQSNFSTVASKIWRKYNYILIFLAIFIVFLIINGEATSLTSIMNIPLHSTVIGIIGLGMGLIILTGDIDLSVGSSLALTGGLGVMIFNMTNNVWIVLAFCLGFGVLLSLFNGVLVGLVKMPAFIVTLATMLMFRSISQTVMNNNGWTIYQLDANLSEWQTLYQVGNVRIADVVPWMVVILLLVVAVTVYISTSTKFGKKIYAVGSNENAARLAGINVSMTRVKVFIFAGILFGLAAFLYLAYNGSVDPATSGRNYELYAIAGVVIGGIAMTGGKGQVLGIIFGTMSFTMIDKIINALGINPLVNDTIKGSILILAILVQLLPQITAARKGKGR
jgi:ribose transport system permease protein